MASDVEQAVRVTAEMVLATAGEVMDLSGELTAKQVELVQAVHDQIEPLVVFLSENPSGTYDEYRSSR